MSGKKKKRHKDTQPAAKRNKSTDPLHPDVPWWKRGLKITVGGIGLLSTVFAVWQGWPAITPRVDATVGTFLDPSKSFSAPFTLSNGRDLISLYDVRVVCLLKEIDFGPKFNIQNNSVQNKDHIAVRLDPGESMSFTCPIMNDDVTSTGPKSATLQLLLYYDSWRSVAFWLPPFLKSARHSECLTFQGRRTFDGHLRWLQQPSCIAPKERLG